MVGSVGSLVAASQRCTTGVQSKWRSNEKYLRHHMPKFQDIFCVALETSERQARDEGKRLDQGGRVGPTWRNLHVVGV
jgi:hypothetical protein